MNNTRKFVEFQLNKITALRSQNHLGVIHHCLRWRFTSSLWTVNIVGRRTVLLIVFLSHLVQGLAQNKYFFFLAVILTAFREIK